MTGIDGILKDGDKKGEPEFAIVLRVTPPHSHAAVLQEKLIPV